MMDEKLKTNVYERVICSFIILIGCVFLLVRACFGWGYRDEPFLLTLAHRLLKGDSLFVNEWQPAQMIGYLNYLITKIYFIFHSNTVGMILNFRYIYIILWTVIIFIIFIRFCNYSKKPFITCFACLYLLLYSSQNILSLSYNFWSLAGVMLFITFLITGTKKWEFFLTGIFYSIATLASPYLAIIFILYYMGYSIYKWILKKEINYKLKEITLYLLYGVIISVLLFIIFFFRHGGSITKAIKSLPYIFNDGEHFRKLFIVLILRYMRDIGFNFIVFESILGILLLLTYFDKKRMNFYYHVHLILFIVLSPLMAYVYRVTWNFAVMQIIFLGFHSIAVKNKNVNVNFLIIYIAGIIFSFVLSSTSDTGITAIANGLVVSGFASIFLIEDSISLTNLKCKRILLSLIAIAQIGTQCYSRLCMYFTDKNLKDNTYLIEKSVCKGLYVTEEVYYEYNEDLKEIEDNIPSHSKICSPSFQCWMFLANDGEYATYSTWPSWGDLDFKLNRFKAYYELNPDKYPNYVYILKKDYDDKYLKEVFVGYEVIECKNAYILKRKSV